MRPTLLGVLILLACASECAAHGSIAYGYTPANAIRFTTSQNEFTAGNAQIAASQQCRLEGLRNCGTLTNFENTCTAVAIAASGGYNIATGKDTDRAGRSAIASCASQRQGACNVATVVCDGTPAPEPQEEIAPPSVD